MKRLNVGSGDDIRPADDGWVNADIRDLPGVDLVCDVGSIPVGDEEFDLVLAQDVLEHIAPSRTREVLREWRRVLKPGGGLEIRIPNLRKIAARFLSGALGEDTAIWLIYGDQSPEAGGEFGAHRTGFTEQQITALLLEEGFTNVVVEPHKTEHNLYITAMRS